MKHTNLLNEMITYNQADPKRIQHFIKVYEFAKLIGEMEQLDEKTQYILETAAIVHDIGIRVAEEKYGHCEGPLQEKEGPPVAIQMLTKLGYDKETIDRVAYLVAHHHTYSGIDGMDYQILVEADFLVNLYEDQATKDMMQTAIDRIFKTKSGEKIGRVMFGITD